MPGIWYSLVAMTVSSVCKKRAHPRRLVILEARSHWKQGVCSSHRDITQKRIKQVKMCSGLILMLLLWVGFP